MRRESWSIGIACACGAFIGAVLAQVIGSSAQYHNVWAAGALGGGLIAYILVDPAHFVASLKQARYAAERDSDESLQEIRRLQSMWRRYRLLQRAHRPLFWKWVFTWVLAWCSAFSTLLGGLVSLMLYFWGVPTNLGQGFLLLGYTFLAISLVALLSGMGGAAWKKGETGKQHRAALRDLDLLLSIAKYGNPIGLVVLAYKYRVIAWAGLRAVAYFFGYLVAYVHSQRRVICFVDTALAIAVCYVSFNSVLAVLIATALGPIVGLINYWLVAPRLERLQAAHC